jgi:hypothetical protein
MLSVFLILVLIAGFLAILALLPRTSSYPLLAVALLLMALALLTTGR